MRGYLAIVSAIVVLYLSTPASAQDANHETSPQDSAALLKLAPPVYPPLARQARITGVINLSVSVRADGTVASVDVISGHPMLKQAAVDSAQQSEFTCSHCSDQLTPYLLTYEFKLEDRDPQDPCAADPNAAPPPLEIDPTKHQVTVSSWAVWICDPASKVEKVRSVKCLYLWKCETRYPL